MQVRGAKLKLHQLHGKPTKLHQLHGKPTKLHQLHGKPTKLHQLHGKPTPAHCFTIISQLPFLHYHLNIFTAVIFIQVFLYYVINQVKFQFYCLNAWNTFTP